MLKQETKTALGLVALLLVIVGVNTGCVAEPEKAVDAMESPVFVIDESEFPGAKPWTSEDFRNDSGNFQFAVLGDRGGGASPLGTYERAMEQLNWLQPEFVMSVGDFVEGYTTVQEEMDEQWEEFEIIIEKLEMPFFHVRGNHDINLPLTSVVRRN